jgi:hypothetical protein
MNIINIMNYHNEERKVYTWTDPECLEGKPEGYLHATEQRIEPGICGGKR